jgi:cobyrinic acid a,c-diamide synthase
VTRAIIDETLRHDPRFASGYRESPRLTTYYLAFNSRLGVLTVGLGAVSSTLIAGVILNRVGSARHVDVLRQACEQAGITVLGALPRIDELTVPSRHLGLVTAVEHGRHARAAVDAMTALVAQHVDLAGVVAAAGGRVNAEPWSAENAAGDRTAGHVTVALAAGKAFSFCYAEHPELLRAAGADVVEFDPLTEQLPPHTAALVLPGGFPEEFSIELSANDRVRQQVAALAAGGAPVHAECAGLTYLVDELDGYPMCGVLAGTARFTDEEVASLRAYLLKGGFLTVDDFWGTRAWDQWAEEIGRVLPPSRYPIADIPPNHAIMHTLYDVKEIEHVV